jgi:hypothetical protein
LALQRNHDAARRRMPPADQWPIGGIVIPVLDCLFARKLNDHDAARPLPFEHFMCAGFGEITSAMLFDKRHCLFEVVGEDCLVLDLVLADVKGGHFRLSA